MANFVDHYRGSVSIQDFGKTGQFEVIRSSILSITEDQRLQMLLVGFAFGTFLEGRRALVLLLQLPLHYLSV